MLQAPVKISSELSGLTIHSYYGKWEINHLSMQFWHEQGNAIHQGVGRKDNELNLLLNLVKTIAKEEGKISVKHDRMLYL